jgi:ribonuclease HII
MGGPIIMIIDPTLRLERRLWRLGLQFIAGLDEAGRGAWAGPVVAAAVVLPSDVAGLASILKGVRDSKQMTAANRARWAPKIRHIARGVGVGLATNGEIDELGLLPATRLAMLRALSELSHAPEYLLIDHLPLPEVDLAQAALTRGDARVLSIACASVIAKVYRDQIMDQMDHEHPGYGFAEHKGYGTRAHQQALHDLSPCEIHRRSYQPIAEYLQGIR